MIRNFSLLLVFKLTLIINNRVLKEKEFSNKENLNELKKNFETKNNILKNQEYREKTYILEREEIYPNTFNAPNKNNYYIFTKDYTINFLTYQDEIFLKKPTHNFPLRNINKIEIRQNLINNNYYIFEKDNFLTQIYENLCSNKTQNYINILKNEFQKENYFLSKKFNNNKISDLLIINLNSQNFEDFSNIIKYIINGKIQSLWKSYEKVFYNPCLIKNFYDKKISLTNGNNEKNPIGMYLVNIKVVIDVSILNFQYFDLFIQQNYTDVKFLKIFLTELIQDIFNFAKANVYFLKSDNLLVDKNNKIFFPFLIENKNNREVIEKNMNFISKQILKIIYKLKNNENSLLAFDYNYFSEILRKIYKIHIEEGIFLDEIILFQQFIDELEHVLMILNDDKRYDFKIPFKKFFKKDFSSSDFFHEKQINMSMSSLLDINSYPSDFEEKEFKVIFCIVKFFFVLSLF